jgi:hypothetical protein
MARSRDLADTTRRTVVALLEWCVYSGAADDPETAMLWRDILVATERLARLLAGLQSPLTRRQKSQIQTLCDTLINLVAALAWLSSEDKQLYVSQVTALEASLAGGD